MVHKMHEWVGDDGENENLMHTVEILSPLCLLEETHEAEYP